MQIVEFQPRPGRWREPQPATDATIHPIGAQAVVHALVAAANAAGYAPSIHDTQPWRWRVAGNTLALYLDRTSILEATDADGRLAILSCGAALHHARVSLLAQGWRVKVARAPTASEPDLLAQLRLEERSTAERAIEPYLRAIPLRHTDRGPVTGAPVDQEQIKSITTAVRAEETWLHVLYPDEVLELARVAEDAQLIEDELDGWQTELAYWNGYDGALAMRRPVRPILPALPMLHGDLRTDAAHDKGATFALLYGHTDEPDDWLRAGEALSAGWLTATADDVSVLPLSAPVEVAATRQAIQIMIGSVGYPYLLLRLGRSTAPPREPTAREPTAQLIERR